MKRRSFITAAATMAGAAAISPSVASPLAASQDSVRELYELRIYQLTGGGSRGPLKKYITTALAPFINNHGGKVGIFSEYGLPEPPRLYVLIQYPHPELVLLTATMLENDRDYQANAAPYLQSPADKPLFTRYENMVLEAFETIPVLRQPAKERGLFELRIYESYNEDAGRRKIIMFNKEELPLFDKLGLNPVFFGKMIAGTYMPALGYMLWFRDMAHRDEVWGKFGSHPDWVTMRDKPEYANTVSKVNRIFLLPEEGSQI